MLFLFILSIYSTAFNIIELSQIAKSTQNGIIVFLEFYDNISLKNFDH